VSFVLQASAGPGIVGDEELRVKINAFALERYFARHEFTAPYLLSCSDCEPLRLTDLLAMADEETLGMWRELSLAYTESAGHPLLREAIARSVADGFDSNDLLVAAPEEAIFLLMHALLSAGDHVVCVTPAYQSLYEVARSIGCEVTAWLPDEARGWRFDLDGLVAQLRPTTRLVVVNFPHNPTGYAPSRDELVDLTETVERHGAYLLSDEMYRMLEVVPGSALPAACGLSERAISLSGLSKSYGLPGLRIGWLATRDHGILEKVLELKDYTTICTAAPSEILAIVALRNRKDIVASHNQRVQRNCALLDDFFVRHSRHFTWNRPTGGSVCFPRYLGPEDTSMLADEAVTRAGIMVVPSALFDFGDRHLRIGFGRDDLPEVAERFGAFLDQR
jgi:aspartate/methionine/tyrosine aminotransferase